MSIGFFYRDSTSVMVRVPAQICSLDGRRFARLEACFLLVDVRIFCFRSINSDESTLQNTRIKKSREDC